MKLFEHSVFKAQIQVDLRYTSGGAGDPRDHFDAHAAEVPQCREHTDCSRVRVSRPIALPKGCVEPAHATHYKTAR